jgi:hypothetical protein
LPRGVPGTRYVPPTGFGYPLGGLLPPSPCRPFFVPAALMGFALRSFLLAEGIRRVSGRMNPHAVYPVGFPCAEALGRPNGPRLLGFDPSGSPSRSKQDWCADRRMLPWASPSQGLPEEASREPSSALLPRASRKPALRPGAAGASEFRSASTSPHPPPASRRAGQGNPHRVLAPDQT